MFQRLIADLKDRLLWRLLRENFRAQAVNYAIAISAMVVIAVTTALTAWIMKDIIELLGAGGDRMQVFVVAGTVALIFSLKGIASYTQVVFLARAGNSIVAHQQRRVYNKLLRHGVSYFKGQASSELLMQVTYSAQSARAVNAGCYGSEIWQHVVQVQVVTRSGELKVRCRGNTRSAIGASTGLR